MSTATRRGGSATSRAAARAQRTIAPGEMAWLLLVPSTLAVVAMVALAGPPLGEALFAPPDARFLPGWVAKGFVRPEPAEHARYLLALLGPVLVGGGVLALARRPRDAHPGVGRLVAIVQVLTLLFGVGMTLAQHMSAFNALHPPEGRAYFTWTTLAVAVVLTAIALAVLRDDQIVSQLKRLTRESRPRRAAAVLLAVGFTVVWLLSSFNTEGSIGNANPAVWTNVPFWLAEPFAVLNGHPPLVHFHSQYGQLWPYATAGLMLVFGTSFTVYSTMMTLATGAALFAIYAVLRRVTGRSLLALALFMPFVATGFFLELGPLSNRYTPGTLYSIFPIRYGGPFLLAWLTARHMDGAGPRRVSLIFLVAGLVVLNNPEFGVPALGATFAALALAGSKRSWPSTLRLLGQAAAGMLAAVALVVLLTLAVAGSLPRFGLLGEFSRLYGSAGFGMLPMPTLGFHLVIYATFAGAIVVAAVRSAEGGRERLLTAMLAWSGVFGLGAGSYFVGRSHQQVLTNIFSAWSFALALLVVVAVRAILARPARRPSPAEVAVLAGFAIAICSLTQTPAPWTQIDRIATATPAPLFRDTPLEHYIASQTRPGEHVGILVPMGQRVAYELELDDEMPYADVGSMPTREQVDTALREFDDAGVRKVFAPIQMEEELRKMLVAAGYKIVRVNSPAQVAVMTR